MTNIYYSTTFRKDELDALRATRSQYLLLSFALNGHKPIKSFFNSLGYRPKSIMIDPGAVTFSGRKMSTGVYDLIDAFAVDGYSEQEAADILLDEVSWLEQMVQPLPFHRYINYLLKNQGDYDYVLAFDEMSCALSSDYCFRVMKCMNLNPVPVFHYRDRMCEWDYLDCYVEEGNELIALGGTLKESKQSKRVDWVKECIRRHPDQKFHLLGTQSEYILDRIPELYSCDGNKWKISASFSCNRFPEQTKVEKSIEIIKKLEIYSSSNGLCETK